MSLFLFSFIVQFLKKKQNFFLGFIFWNCGLIFWWFYIFQLNSLVVAFTDFDFFICFYTTRGSTIGGIQKCWFYTFSRYWTFSQVFSFFPLGVILRQPNLRTMTTCHNLSTKTSTLFTALFGAHCEQPINNDHYSWVLRFDCINKIFFCSWNSKT